MRHEASDQFQDAVSCGVVADRKPPLRTRLPRVLANRYPELCLPFLCLAAFLALHDVPLTHDVVWQLWIARQITHGAELYSQIVELNPPLWFWMAIPVVRLSETGLLAPGAALVLGMMIAVCASGLLLARLVWDFAPSSRFVLLVAAALLMTLMPLSDFGQREHLALIAAAPYVALAARRFEGASVAPALAIAVGIFAAAAFALKHYFLAIPVLLELWLLVGRRGGWRPLRPETGALALCAFVYGAVVLFLTPAFLTEMVPLVDAAYFGYENPLARQLDEPAQAIWVLLLAVLYGCWRSPSCRLPPLATAFLIAAGGFAFAYFAQQKGWQYHAIPVTGCLGLAVAAVAACHPSWMRRPLGQPLIAAGLVMPLLIGLLLGPYANGLDGMTRRALAPARAGESILILSARPRYGWPFVEQKELRWISRYFTFWMIPAIASYERRGSVPSQIARISNDIRAKTVEDMRCNPPDHILVVSDPLEPRFDMLEFFRRDAAFATLFAGYDRIERVGHITSYRARLAHRPRAAAHCRPIS